MMDKVKRTLALLLLAVASVAALAEGRWKCYLAYHDTEAVVRAGETVYVLTNGNLFSYNVADKSVQTFDKAGLLSDCGISHIRWSKRANRLLIVYDNGNIDLLDPSSNVTNVPELYNEILQYDKHVNSVLLSDRSAKAYLGTGFGVSVVDMEEAVVRENCILGMSVSQLSQTADSLYAQTDSLGLLACSFRDAIINKHNWHESTATIEASADDSATDSIADNISVDGPAYNYFYYSTFLNSTLYTCGGYMAAGGDDPERPGIVQLLRDDEQWIIAEGRLDTITGRKYLDHNCVAGDPKDPDHYFASGRTGLYEFQGTKLVKAYEPGDGLMGLADLGNGHTSRNYSMTQGIVFDNDGNLWILQCMSVHPLVCLKADGTWEDHPNELMMQDGVSGNNLTKPIIDHKGRLWFVNYNWRMPALFSYDPETRQMRRYDNFTAKDGSALNSAYPICVAEDREGNVWLGTDRGLLMIENSDTDADGIVFNQLRVDGNYFLAGEVINSIVVDTQNRKWFATDGDGVFLLSADNDEQLMHFTRDNSPLLSDIVSAVSLDTLNQRAYFSTDLGLCSYQELPDEPAIETLEKDAVYAYPNPVRPDHEGMVTITGLPDGVDVRIVSTAGMLVAKGKSTGGRFEWDVTAGDGRRVHSGIYHVLLASHGGRKGMVCRIAVVN